METGGSTIEKRPIPLKVWVLISGYSGEGGGILGVYEDETDAIKAATKLVDAEMEYAVKHFSKKDPQFTVYNCSYPSETLRIWKEYYAWRHGVANEDGSIGWSHAHGSGRYFKVECFELQQQATAPKS